MVVRVVQEDDEVQDDDGEDAYADDMTITVE